MGQAGVEVDAVAWVECQLFAADAQEQAAFDDEVELLSVVRVVVHGAVAGFDGDDEGVGLAVAEAGGQGLVLVDLGALYADAMSGAGEEVGAHLGFFAEHEGVECDAVVAGYLLEHADGDVVLAGFGAFILGLVDAAVGGHFGGG